MRQLQLVLLVLFCALECGSFTAPYSPPVLSSIPESAREGTSVTLQCRFDRPADLNQVTIFRVESSRLIFQRATTAKLPVYSVQFPNVSPKNRGRYQCTAVYSNGSRLTADYYLEVWRPHGTPTSPHIEPVEVEENTSFSVKCGGDVGYPFGVLQLVSNSTRLEGFRSVSRGCGALASTCYLLEREPEPNECQFTGDQKSKLCSWIIPRADVSADGMALWCRAKNNYSLEEPLYSIPKTLRVHYAPRDMKLLTSNGDLITPTQPVASFQMNGNENDAVWIECSATGNPSPSVRWQQMSHETLDSSAFRLNGSRLEITAAAAQLVSPLFECAAANRIGNVTRRVTVNVTLVHTHVSVESATTPQKLHVHQKVAAFNEQTTPAELSDNTAFAFAVLSLAILLLLLVLLAAIVFYMILYISCKIRHARRIDPDGAVGDVLKTTDCEPQTSHLEGNASGGDMLSEGRHSAVEQHCPLSMSTRQQ